MLEPYDYGLHFTFCLWFGHKWTKFYILYFMSTKAHVYSKWKKISIFEKKLKLLWILEVFGLGKLISILKRAQKSQNFSTSVTFYEEHQSKNHDKIVSISICRNSMG